MVFLVILGEYVVRLYLFFRKAKVGIVVYGMAMKSDSISVVSVEKKPAETTEYKPLEILNSYDMKLFLHPEK